MGSMRTSSNVDFGRQKSDFGTSNGNFYGWIQPKIFEL